MALPLEGFYIFNFFLKQLIFPSGLSVGRALPVQPAGLAASAHLPLVQQPPVLLLQLVLLLLEEEPEPVPVELQAGLVLLPLPLPVVHRHAGNQGGVNWLHWSGESLWEWGGAYLLLRYCREVQMSCLSLQRFCRSR